MTLPSPPPSPNPASFPPLRCFKFEVPSSPSLPSPPDFEVRIRSRTLLPKFEVPSSKFEVFGIRVFQERPGRKARKSRARSLERALRTPRDAVRKVATRRAQLHQPAPTLWHKEKTRRVQTTQDQTGAVRKAKVRDLALDNMAAVVVDRFGEVWQAHRANISSRMVPPSLCAKVQQQMLHVYLANSRRREAGIQITAWRCQAAELEAAEGHLHSWPTGQSSSREKARCCPNTCISQ